MRVWSLGCRAPACEGCVDEPSVEARFPPNDASRRSRAADPREMADPKFDAPGIDPVTDPCHDTRI